MNPFAITVTVSGTDDEGIVRSFTGTGTIYAQQVVDNTYEIDGTPTPFTLDDRGLPLFAYIENLGTVDIAYACVDSADDSVSLVVPPGASTIVNMSEIAKNNVGTALYMWTQTGTANVRYILFY